MRKRASDLDLIGGSSWQLIDTPRELVWQALHDVPRYTKMIPGVIEAQETKRTGAQRSVFIRQGAWPVIGSYHVLVRSDPLTWTIAFELDESFPHDLVSGWGLIRLTDYGDGRTVLTFAVLADLGHGVLELAARPLVQKWALRLPSTVNTFLKTNGRRLYGPR